MKRLQVLLIAVFINSAILFSQGFYFKTSSLYNVSIFKQQMPECFTYEIEIPVYTGYDNFIADFSTDEFSIASGLSFQGAAGYSLNDFLSFELKFSTFRNSKKEFEPSHKGSLDINSEWNMRYYSIMPTVMLGQTFNKSTVNIFVYSGFGISKLNIKASVNQDFREYEFNKSKTFLWGYGIEYAYALSNKLSLFTESGINNTNYKPEKAKLISSYYSMEYFTTSQKEIIYVDDITNLEVRYDGSIDPDSPEMRLREKLKLNSIHLGFGIKFSL